MLAEQLKHLDAVNIGATGTGSSSAYTDTT